MKKRIKTAICILLCAWLAFAGSTAVCAMDTPWVPLLPDAGNGEPGTGQMSETENTAPPDSEAPARKTDEPAQTDAVGSAAPSGEKRKTSGCFGNVHADWFILLLPLFTTVLTNGKNSHKRVPKSK